MLESMTGFAEVTDRRKGGTVRISLKSVNGKNLNIHTTLNRQCVEIEEEAYRLIRDTFARGSVQAVITLKTDPLADRLVRGLAARLAAIRKQIGPVSAEIGSLLRALPGAQDTDDITPDVRRAVAVLLKRAVAALKKSRLAEGAKLTKVLRTKAAGVQRTIIRIKKALPAIQKSTQARLTAALRDSVTAMQAEFDRNAVLHEIASRLEKNDCTEEADRALIHIAAFLETVDRADPATGKKLDFLCQELHREINTMSVKIRDGGYSTRIVDLKAEIEMIREQVQNVQ